MFTLSAACPKIKARLRSRYKLETSSKTSPTLGASSDGTMSGASGASGRRPADAGGFGPQERVPLLPLIGKLGLEVEFEVGRQVSGYNDAPLNVLPQVLL